MNKERILKLADHIEKLPHLHDTCETSDMYDMYTEAANNGTLFFDFNHYVMDVEDQRTRDDGGHFCKTPACIAGHAVYLFMPDAAEKMKKGEGINYNVVARDLLDLDIDDANYLFGTHSRVDFNHEKATPQMAAAMLRELAKTGVMPDWPDEVAENDSRFSDDDDEHDEDYD